MIVSDSRIDRERILHQPEVLTYHNIGNVCSLATTPRVIADVDNDIVSIWGANMPIEDHLSVTFLDELYGIGRERITEVEIYPVVYSLSAEERESSEGILELEDKVNFSGVIVNYKSKKSTSRPIMQMIDDEDLKKYLLNMEYSIFMDQTQDGEPYSPTELLGIVLTSGLNLHRRLKNCPYETMKIKIKIPASTVIHCYGLEDQEAATSKEIKDTVSEFLVSRLSGEGTGSSGYPIGRLDKDLISIEIVKDKTVKQKEKNLPVAYNEIMSAYMNSFDVSRDL